jgi:aryl-alcohol dehydrogenase
VPQVFIPRLIQLWQNGQFPFEKLIKHYTLGEINQAFDDSADGSTIKPVVCF